jgi:MinD-like ATPase involved in chromosome partitioning or flagellar assembly
MINSKNIYLIGGSKGGVGKSIVSMSLIDYFIDKEENILLIETDTSNPDVYKNYHEEINTKLIDLEEADGWIELLNICDSNKDSVIVINTKAANNNAVKKYGENLNSSLEALGRKLIALWVINRQKDSLLLLKDFREALPNAIVHVIRNEYFGDENKYQLYNSGKTKIDIENQGGLSLNFPDIADSIADTLYTERLSIKKAIDTLPIGNKAELKRWKNLAKNTFDKII